MWGSYTGCTRNSRGKPMKDRFLSTLSNERKFPEVGANSIVSSWRSVRLSRECENKRTDLYIHARGIARIHIHALLTHTDELGEKRGCAGGGVTYFPPFRLREFNALSVPRCRLARK